MKKIYSFVLMAAMLLVGTSVKATSYPIGSSDELVAAFAEAANGEEFILQSSMQVSQQLVLDKDAYVVLNLNGNVLQMNNTTGENNAGILIKHGRLEIKNGGKITNASPTTYDLIRLNGTNTAIDAKQTPYSQVIVQEGVLIENLTTNAISITEATGTNNLANGARIDVYGEISAEKYGIKVNGTVYKPANVDHSPYVWIHEGANVHVNANATKAVAAYSSGFARWLIEGYCGGSTGLYVKGGQVELHDATITSLNTTAATPPVGQGSGVTAGGSAIVVESNAAYPGDIQVTISGNTEVSATKGYAIEETITTATNTEVEMIKIEGGVISGGAAGAIIVEDKTAKNGDQASGKVVVVGGNVGGNIIVDQNSNTGNPDQEGPRTLVSIPVESLGGYVDFSDQTSEATAAVVNVDGKNTIVFVPVGTTSSYPVTLNDEYLATFSAVENVTIPDGLKAYKAGEMGNNTLELSEITGGIIPAATGVILYNAAKNEKNFTLVETTSNATADLTGNTLKPAVAWLASYAGSAYILHGSELYLYNGIKMKENKAFLKFVNSNPGSAAPQRIRLVFHETEQATEIGNVEVTTVKAVKFVENGEILIRRGENVYNLQGQIVK